MQIDVYTSTGDKKGTWSLPPSLFEATIRMPLMHQAVTLQQSNRRRPIAHAKTRGEVAGSTRKLYAQKGTGRARRGSIRSPLLRGGGKAFGPSKERNFQKDMPKGMRHAALRSCLSFQATKATIIGLESYPATIKTREAAVLIKKLPLNGGRSTLFVLPSAHEALTMSVRNIPGIKTVRADYLNPEAVLWARGIVFLAGAIEKAESIFGKQPKQPTEPKKPRKVGSKKSSVPSVTSVSSSSSS